GLVLAEKNPDVPLPPASMSKIMTVFMVFEAVSDGHLALTDRLPVSADAVKYRGSSMFLKAGERVTVEDLIRGVIVLSGNDASAVLAEAMSPDGTEAGFARLMTTRGQEIGLTQSIFRNSNGWPHPDHRMSVRDLATVSSEIITRFPDLYAYFGEREFAFDNRVPENRRNRNPLLTLDIGADGLKTGYTSEAGYGLTGSAKRGNRRIVFVVTGLSNRAIREQESEKIINWYNFQYADKELFRSGDTVVSIPVFMGDKPKLAATVAETVSVPVATRSGQDTGINANVIYDSLLETPISKGQVVGRLEVQLQEFDTILTFPLIANEDVGDGGFSVRMKTALANLATKIGLDGFLDR
ncbi:MAG: D-alanyl-D-alanine carboxypeptidase, partial [Rhodobacteraceae bacterium]|nr:D-alanyl-D-alanine carboxypeptidase [Paracoccaceae bacterium]